MFMYKYINKRLPDIFNGWFTHFQNIRKSKSFIVPFFKTDRSQHTIPYYGSKIWNIIIQEIDADCAIGTFKCRLRSLLLSKHCEPFKKVFKPDK